MPTLSCKRFKLLTLQAKLVAVLACIAAVLCPSAFSQSGTMSTYAGINTVQYRLNGTATPDPTIAVGTLEYCEHVNSGYQCWYKSGANANQPVTFLGSNAPKSDATPWSQNSNNNGNTSHCPTAFTPNSQLLHDNVYNLWIMEKRVTYASTGHNYMCVAISNVEDIASTSPAFAWFAFEYDLDTVIPTNAEGNYYYPDYPQSGLWQTSTSTAPPYTAASDQALWITYDLQDVNNQDNINGVLVCAVDLAGLRASTASPYVNNSKTPACTVAHTLTPYNQRRSWVPANNSDTTPPIAADGEMFTNLVEPPENNTSYLTSPTDTQEVEQWTIDWTAATPTPTFLNTWQLPSTQPNGDQLGCFFAENYYDTVCIPQPSTATTGIHIDSVADRMQQFFHYTSNGGQGSVWTSAHDIQIVPSNTKLTQTEADIRILQRNTAAPNAVYVAADYPIVDPVDSAAFVFLPSIVRDKAGNLQGILGISGSGVNEHPGLDSLTFNPGTHASGTWGYIASPLTDGDAEDTDSLNYRWGDWYSGVLDPSDSCTVWVAGEYLPANRTTEPYWYTEMATLPPIGTCAGGPVLLSNVSLSFGSQAVGVKSAALVETVTNNQTTSLNISAISSGGGVFQQSNTCENAISPGGNCTISVYFTPSAVGTTTGTLTITDGVTGSPQSVALAGIGTAANTTGTISVSPTSLAFGSQVLNTASAGKAITVTNTGSVNVTVSSVAASGAYSETGTCSGATLTPGQTCTITVGFTPVVTGATTGTITITDNATGTPQIVNLTGSGELAVSMSANLTFPTTDVGTSSASQTMTLSNNQSQSLSFTFATSGDYTAVGSGASPCTGTLAAKSKCSFAVTFTPTYNGTIKGALTVTHNAVGSPTSGGLSGTGADGTAVPLTFNPANLNFGNIALSAALTKTVTVKNVSAATVTLTSITGSGYFIVKSGGATPCNGAILSGKTCTFNATFQPLATGSFIGSITVVDNSSVSTQVQNAAGTGIEPVTLAPTTLSFGTVAVGSTSPVAIITVTNYLATAVAIDGVVASGDFIATTGGTAPCGTSIPAKGTCDLGVEFSPAAAGTINGDLTVTFAAGDSPLVVSLAGTGSN